MISYGIYGIGLFWVRLCIILEIIGMVLAIRYENVTEKNEYIYRMYIMTTQCVGIVC